MDLPGRPRPSGERRWLRGGERLCAEEDLETHVEDASELGQHVGARGLVGALPEGDVFLGFADEASELSLAEAGGFAQGEQAGSLCRARFLGAWRKGL